jgi:hypothetical protein
MIGAASLVSSQAQVYSVNIVGYINLTIYKGWNLVANQLNNSAGNDVATLIPTAPGALGVFSYDGANQRYNNVNFDPELGWDGTMTLNPGQGFFCYNQSGQEFTLTLVGEVQTGTTTLTLYQGWQLISLVVPQDGQLADVGDGSPNFGYPPSALDAIFTYNGALQRYDNYNYDTELGWDSTPVVQVGKGFFALRSGAGASGSWSRTFNVSGN